MIDWTMSGSDQSSAYRIVARTRRFAIGIRTLGHGAIRVRIQCVDGSETWDGLSIEIDRKSATHASVIVHASELPAAIHTAVNWAVQKELADVQE